MLLLQFAHKRDAFLERQADHIVQVVLELEKPGKTDSRKPGLQSNGTLR